MRHDRGGWRYWFRQRRWWRRWLVVHWFCVEEDDGFYLFIFFVGSGNKSKSITPSVPISFFGCPKINVHFEKSENKMYKLPKIPSFINKSNNLKSYLKSNHCVSLKGNLRSLVIKNCNYCVPLNSWNSKVGYLNWDGGNSFFNV